MKKTKKTKATSPFEKGLELFRTNPEPDWRVFVQAAMFAARDQGDSVLEVKAYMKTMLTEFVLKEMGYE